MRTSRSCSRSRTSTGTVLTFRSRAIRLTLLVALATQTTNGAALGSALGAGAAVIGHIPAVIDQGKKIEHTIEDAWNVAKKIEGEVLIASHEDWKERDLQIELSIVNRTTDKIITIEASDTNRVEPYYFYYGQLAKTQPVKSSRETDKTRTQVAGPGQILTLAVSKAYRSIVGVSGGLTATIKDARKELVKSDQPKQFDPEFYMNAAFKSCYNLDPLDDAKKLDVNLSKLAVDFFGMSECERIHNEMWNAPAGQYMTATQIKREYREIDGRGKYIKTIKVTDDGERLDKYYRVHVQIADKCQHTFKKKNGIHYIYTIEEMDGAEGSPVVLQHKKEGAQIQHIPEPQAQIQHIPEPHVVAEIAQPYQNSWNNDVFVNSFAPVQ